MDVTPIEQPRTYVVSLTLSNDELVELLNSRVVLPDNLVAVKDLLDKIASATS